VLRGREVLVANTREEQVAVGIRGGRPGTDWCLSCVNVPIVAGDRVLGLIGLENHEREHAFGESQVRLLTTVAASMGLALENLRLFNETKEALEQQTATAKVLQVVSRSPTDVQPVFEAILDSALALCGATIGGVARFDGELVHLASFHAPTPEGPRRHEGGVPMKPSRRSILARAILEREVVQIYDVLADPDYALKEETLRVGYRGNLAVPMIRDGEVIGAIGVCREQPSVYPEKHVRLLRIFADQAVIAIENVRLFNETRDALRKVEQRTRELAEALGLPGRDQRRAARHQPCRRRTSAGVRGDPRLRDALVRQRRRRRLPYRDGLVDPDGRAQLAAEAARGRAQRSTRRRPPRPCWPAASSRPGQALSRSTSALVGPLEQPGVSHRPAHGGACRRADATARRKPIGANPGRSGRNPGETPRPPGSTCSRPFADQAVIAIENVRLFNETKEALEQQTATAEILRVISSSPTDVQPVFDAIAERAMVLCGGSDGRDDALRRRAAAHRELHGGRSSARNAMRAAFPMKLGRGSSTVRAVLAKAPVQIADVRPTRSTRSRRRPTRPAGRARVGADAARRPRPSARSRSRAPEPGPFRRKSSRCSRPSRARR
jgi:GAF domain-containing protein